MSRKKLSRRESTPEAFQRRLQNRFQKADDAVESEREKAPAPRTTEPTVRQEETAPAKVPRRNFTLDPESDELLEDQVLRFARLGVVKNRSEIIRGALRALAGMKDGEAAEVLRQIAALRRGARSKRR